MHFAMQLADVLLLEFEDKKSVGFFFTANDHETLITRTKSFSDESIPSGNAVAAFALGRLGHILGNTQYIDAAERTVRAAWPKLQQMPYGHASLLLALEDILFPPTIIVLRGSESVVKEWQSLCQKKYAPNQLCLAIDNTYNDLPEGLAERLPKRLSEHLEHLSEHRAQDEGIAYICSGFQCAAPIHSSDELQAKLSL